MRGRMVAVAAVALTGLTLAGAGTAVPERDAVVRMGKGIGKVQLGMTLPQVRRALGGRHVSLVHRANFGTRGRYVELEWEVPGRRSWEPDIWDVGFRGVSRKGKLRVVRVTTSARSQRTREGLGVGSRPRQIVRAYRDATCVSRFSLGQTIVTSGTWVVVGQPRRGMMAFRIDNSREQGSNPTFRQVVGVMAQRDWFSKGRFHTTCGRDWERW